MKGTMYLDISIWIYALNVIGERPLYYQNNIKLHLHQYSIPVPDLRILKSDRAHNLSSMSTAGSYIEDFLYCKKLRLP